MVISVYGKYDFTAANSLVSPIASLLQFAFLIMAVLLGVSEATMPCPYGVFIVIDVIGAALLCVTGSVQTDWLLLPPAGGSAGHLAGRAFFCFIPVSSGRSSLGQNAR